MFNSVTNSWRGKGHLLHQFQRGSFDSYKPYTNETSPIASPPVMSPHGSSVSGAAFQQQQQPWGLAHRTGAGNSLHSSSEGLESGAEGSVGDGLGLSAGGTASVGGSLTGLTGSVGGVDSSTAAAAATAAGSLSGGSSRRWSSSSGGTSDSGVGAARGVELAGGDIASRRLRLPAKAAGKGIRMPPTLGSDGVPPTHQTISELHSMQLPVRAQLVLLVLTVGRWLATCSLQPPLLMLNYAPVRSALDSSHRPCCQAQQAFMLNPKPWHHITFMLT